MLRDWGIVIELDIIGTGPEENASRALVSRLGLEELATFKGHIEHGDGLRQAFLASDIFVLPSRTEGTPRALVEAMGMGLVPVAARVGGIPDVIEHMKNGLLIPPESSEALARAIRSLLDGGSELLAAYSKAAWLKSRAYSFAEVGPALITMLANKDLRD